MLYDYHSSYIFLLQSVLTVQHNYPEKQLRQLGQSMANKTCNGYHEIIHYFPKQKIFTSSLGGFPLPNQHNRDYMISFL